MKLTTYSICHRNEVWEYLGVRYKTGSNGCFVQQERHFLEALWSKTTSVKFRALGSKKNEARWRGNSRNL